MSKDADPSFSIPWYTISFPEIIEKSAREFFLDANLAAKLGPPVLCYLRG